MSNSLVAIANHVKKGDALLLRLKSARERGAIAKYVCASCGAGMASYGRLWMPTIPLWRKASGSLTRDRGKWPGWQEHIRAKLKSFC